jgi:hypothetical protein
MDIMKNDYVQQIRKENLIVFLYSCIYWTAVNMIITINKLIEKDVERSSEGYFKMPFQHFLRD